MLSYLHGYHAGNHADVLKHTVLTAALARLVAKEKPLRYIDTHAGAGGYELRAAAAQKNREYASGVGKLWLETSPPAAVARWLALAERYNGSGPPKRYPGSPWLAKQLLRQTDDLFLFELHPAEHRALTKAFDYELRDEHRNVIDAAVKLHARFSTGTLLIWYPVIERRWVERYERALRAAGIGAVATYELCVARERRDGGLTGSGMFVVNPPWPLDEELGAALPWLVERLAIDDGAGYRAAS
jgi:23S rRNA (adenine2030-N6)-methyltransferase